jgi:hypothetical protein
VLNVFFKKCPKCAGDLFRNPVEHVTSCLQCSRTLSTAEEERLLGIVPPPPPKIDPLPPAKRGRPRKHPVAA